MIIQVSSRRADNIKGLCSVPGLCFKTDRSRRRLARRPELWKSCLMSNSQRNWECLVWKRGDWNGAGLEVESGWHGACCSLQIFEGFSFGRGIDLLCSVSKDERNMIGNRKGSFGQYMSKYTHCSCTC